MINQKKRVTTTVAIIALLWINLPAINAQTDSVKSFPGAEGYGANTPGGRGGKVYFVSNLNDSGAGSLREACEAYGPRIVVFTVSGIIDLQSSLHIQNPYITIAGQTAPGDGICLKRSELKISTHDVIVRYIRVRLGDISGRAVDAISVVKGAHDVIVDHCSASWSIDEGLSPSGSIYNVTVQWCIVGQSLNKSIHKKGSHGYGSLVRGIGGITLHHNLWINNSARNPRLGDNYNQPPWPTHDVRNNVMYNWGEMCTGMTGGNIHVNYVGNYLKPGPNSSDRTPIVLTNTANVKFFLAGNVYEGRPEYSDKPASMFSEEFHEGRKLFELVNEPFQTPVVSTSSAETAYQEVLAAVGANLPARDRIDKELIAQVKENKGKIINSQADVGGWPAYASAAPPIDSDQDGIPDRWEQDHGLDAHNGRDASNTGKEGYTHLETYLNELAADHSAIARQ